MYQFKQESTIILICILTIIIFYCVCWIFKILNRIEIELFSNSDSKRDRMKQIYKSDDVSDPDEMTSDDPDNLNVNDPDDESSMDPDR
jgi:hypothetical protein